MIERLSHENQETRAANEEKDKKLDRLSRDLAAALEGFQTLQESYKEQKRINDKQDLRNKELESSLTESNTNVEMLNEKQAALAAAHASELALQKESEARLKEKMAAENKRLAAEYEERLSREKLLVAAQKKPEPIPGDVGVEVLEDKGRMRVIIARKKATGEIAVTE